MVSRSSKAAEHSHVHLLREEHDEDAVATLKQAVTAQSSSHSRQGPDGKLYAHLDRQKQLGDEESDAVKVIPKTTISQSPRMTEEEEQVLAADTKFPRSVFFIIGNEFCERYVLTNIMSTN